jgi:hypothetical protein
MLGGKHGRPEANVNQDDVKGFVADWLRENVHDSDRSMATALAKQCRADALVAGIPNRQLNAAVNDMTGGGSGLVALIADAAERLTDEEVRRLAAKDD